MGQLTDARERQNNAERAEKKKAAAIKTRYDNFLLGTGFGYTAAIMLTAEYKERVNKIEPIELADTWTFNLPDQPEAYDPTISHYTRDRKSVV